MINNSLFITSTHHLGENMIMLLCAALFSIFIKAIVAQHGSYPSGWLLGNGNNEMELPLAFYDWLSSNDGELCGDQLTTVSSQLQFSVSGQKAIGHATYSTDPAKCTAEIEILHGVQTSTNLTPIVNGVKVDFCPAWKGAKTMKHASVGVSFTYSGFTFTGDATTTDSFVTDICGSWTLKSNVPHSYPSVCLVDVSPTTVSNTCLVISLDLREQASPDVNICKRDQPCPSGLDCPAVCHKLMETVCHIGQDVSQKLDEAAFSGQLPYCLSP